MGFQVSCSCERPCNSPFTTQNSSELRSLPSPPPHGDCYAHSSKLGNTLNSTTFTSQSDGRSFCHEAHGGFNTACQWRMSKIAGGRGALCCVWLGSNTLTPTSPMETQIHSKFIHMPLPHSQT